MTPELPQENLKLNRETAFQLYATFCGDVERTAHALNVTPGEVIDVAERCRWNDKLKVILALKRSAAPGDVERSISRALNFVQAHRYRMFLDRVINEFTDMTPNELRQYIFNEEARDGRIKHSLSTRALADLASALEKCHAATYLALSDTSSDRSRRDEADPGGEASGAIHAAIAKAMSEAGAESPAGLLFDAQVEQANARLKRVNSAPAANPYDA